MVGLLLLEPLVSEKVLLEGYPGSLPNLGRKSWLVSSDLELLLLKA